MADQTKQQLNHIDAHGNAIMVDVGAKDITQRIATAGGSKEELQTIISEAVLNKPAHHAFSEHPEETEGKGMYRIGG